MTNTDTAEGLRKAARRLFWEARKLETGDASKRSDKEILDAFMAGFLPPISSLFHSARKSESKEMDAIEAVFTVVYHAFDHGINKSNTASAIEMGIASSDFVLTKFFGLSDEQINKLWLKAKKGLNEDGFALRSKE